MMEKKSDNNVAMQDNEYWTSPKIVLKCVLPKLVPFFKTVAIYFVLDIPREKPSWFACLIKCLPIISLCFFVVLHGMSLSEKHAYARKILLGLIFSCVGDLLLIWPSCFTLGMISFAIAHVIYIAAFGMKPLNIYAGSLCFGLVLLATYFLYPGFYGIFTFVVPVYTFILMFMVWRAIARVQNDFWTWTKLCSCGGGFLFALSDGIIGVTMFLTNLPYAKDLIMLLYYAAQLGISLSVVDCEIMTILSVAHSSSPNSCHVKTNEKEKSHNMKDVRQRVFAN